MDHPLPTAAEVLSRADLSGNAKVAWLGLTDFMGRDEIARPHMADLRAAVGQPDRTLRRALAELVDRGLLEALPQDGGAGFRFLGYQAPAKFPAASDPSPMTRGAKRMPHRLPEHWCPSPETLAHCHRLRPDIDLSREIEAMRYWFTHGNGRGTQRGSWDQTYVGWIERSLPASAGPGGARPAAAGRGPPESEGARRLREIIEQERTA
jgi:hypothetical protein